MLSRHRFRHSLGVAETARDLCRNLSADPEDCYIAGLLHDCARELPPDRIASLARQDGVKAIPDDMRRIMLLHGHAGAVLAQRDFGIRDERILDALRHHVTGAPGMSDLEKAVFIADYLEPGRPWMTDGSMTHVLRLSFDGMIREILTHTFRYLESAARTIEESSVLLYDEVSNGTRA